MFGEECFSAECHWLL